MQNASASPNTISAVKALLRSCQAKLIQPDADF